MKHKSHKANYSSLLMRILSTAFIGLLPIGANASSHQDAPLITFDDAANTTDVYAFLTERDGTKYLFAGLAVYPFETPGIGPNKHNFDDNVRYEIHIATGNDVATGRATFSYQFDFKTIFRNEGTILQSYLDVVNDVGDEAQNLVQTYTVKKINNVKQWKSKILGKGIVPPNNQGIVTPFYNLADNGERPAKPGVDDPANLDRYTNQSIALLKDNHRAFAGQREDGFFADIQAVFDLLQFRHPNIPETPNSSFDSQSGFNVHFIGLEIPVESIGGDLQQVGVYATTSRRKFSVLKPDRHRNLSTTFGHFVQVGRQGNPLFNEGFVAIEDKDLYSRTKPTADAYLFSKYAESPELGALVNALFGASVLANDRTDLAGIFIPDLIKVDLSTEPARLIGGGNDDPGFSPLGIFGGDTLTSQIQSGFFGNGTLPGGWPNGRRFGDDVLDIALIALFSDLRDPLNPIINFPPVNDNVDTNDSVQNKVFPYAGTPHNGRNYRANPNQVQVP